VDYNNITEPATEHATSSPADDVHHYVIPQKLLDSIFNIFPVLMHQWEKENAVIYPVEVQPP
jgi:hypothetical protein